MATASVIHFTDGYKIDHRRQYPEGTTLVYSNFTPRKSQLPGVGHVVFFGLQYAIKRYLMEAFEQSFFNRPKLEVIARYKRRIEAYLGPDAITFEHIGQLHDLGYLPIEIRALPEGCQVPIRVPMFTIHNTLPEFFWLTNYLETLLTTCLWLPCTNATIAAEYRRMLSDFAQRTGSDPGFVTWQGHDFSFRGMGGVEAALLSGAAHLLIFDGTDTVPAIDFLEDYYGANVETDSVGGSVAATEHSVMCMGTQAGEYETFRRLIEDIYPSGIVSIVSDTWDYWQVIDDFMPRLKASILRREGKVVIRPDSGNPLHIICGDPNAPEGSPQRKGTMERLWEIFGGSTTPTGHRLLDPHIGVIYGDGVTLQRCRALCEGLSDKGFASGNLVFGIGASTYQQVNRDTFGFAMKATYGEVKGEGRAIFKAPKTDDGTKRSARGLLRVNCLRGAFQLQDQCTWEEAQGGCLRPVFRNGALLVDWDWGDLKAHLGMSQKAKQLYDNYYMADRFEMVFKDDSIFTLRGEEWYYDKKIFWYDHLDNINKFYEVYYDKGLPVKIRDRFYPNTFEIKDYETFCAWCRQYQSIEFVDIFKDVYTEQAFCSIGQQAVDKAKTKLENLSSFTPDESYITWNVPYDIQWLEGHTHSLLAAIGRERRIGNIRAECLDKLESCFLALKQAPIGYPVGVIEYYHKNYRKQSGQYLRDLYTQHLAALLAAEVAFKALG